MPSIKLDPTLLDSNLWLDRDVRDVFLTALLMAKPFEVSSSLQGFHFDGNGAIDIPTGHYGLVSASHEGLIARAGLTQEAGVKAVTKLCSTDPLEMFIPFGGRAMVRIVGGFLLLNYTQYRLHDPGSYDRVKRWREKRRDEVKVVKRKPRVTDDGDFNIFWEAYPRKTAKEKARQSWSKLTMTKELLEKILSAVDVHSKLDQWTKDNGAFIPHASTWLNQKRWEDEIDKPAAQKSTEDISKSWSRPAPVVTSTIPLEPVQDEKLELF